MSEIWGLIFGRAYLAGGGGGEGLIIGILRYLKNRLITKNLTIPVPVGICTSFTGK